MPRRHVNVKRVQGMQPVLARAWWIVAPSISAAARHILEPVEHLLALELGGSHHLIRSLRSTAQSAGRHHTAQGSGARWDGRSR